jgi:DNA-binding MarR family transcriptional regulator
MARTAYAELVSTESALSAATSRKLTLAAGASTGAGLGDAGIDVTRLRVALARLSRRLRRHELAGLTPTQLAALATVGTSGPMRLGDLAAAEGIAPSTLTRLVTALEDSGYVRRFPDPSDARASTLAITPHGQEALERIRTESTLLLTESLELLTPAQRSALAEALPVLEQLAEVPGSSAGPAGSVAGPAGSVAGPAGSAAGPAGSAAGSPRSSAAGPAESKGRLGLIDVSQAAG